MPGSYLPEDMMRDGELDWDRIRSLLESHEAQIDWWEGEEPDYYLRAGITGEDRVFHGAFYGRCVHLAHDGCRLPLEGHPYECRMLEPIKKGECRGHYDGACTGKERAKDLWKPYARQLYAVGESVSNSTILNNAKGDNHGRD